MQVLPQVFQQKRAEMENALGHFKSDIAAIRTGRASPGLIEDIRVQAYGSPMAIRELATLSMPDSRTVVVQPWDKNVLAAVERAIQQSGLGIQPIVDGAVLRLTVPQLSEERRREFVDHLHRKAEQARIRIRQIREDGWRVIQRMQKEGDIREDEKFQSKDKLQEMVDEFNKKIEELTTKKEKELMS